MKDRQSKEERQSCLSQNQGRIVVANDKLAYKIYSDYFPRQMIAMISNTDTLIEAQRW